MILENRRRRTPSSAKYDTDEFREDNKKLHVYAMISNLFQFPTVTICPSRNMQPDTWSFVDRLYNLVDGGSERAKELFG